MAQFLHIGNFVIGFGHERAAGTFILGCRRACIAGESLNSDLLCLNLAHN